MSKSNTCFHCGTSSDDRVLLKCEEKGQEKHVCVRCLPILIHGKH